MASFNRIILAGNLTRDPEVKFAQSGTAICGISLAVNDRRKNGDNWEDVTSFVDCTLFGRTAELCGEYCKKGSNILVEGKIRQEHWEKDGVKRSKLAVIVDQLQFLGGKRDNVDAPTPSRGQATKPAPQQTEDIPF